jgi:N-acyl amino acid synthase of PEP-CTERM/exosortase system
MRALLIEDDNAMARSVELMLRSEGFDVYTTDLGEEGTHLAQLNDYDIILLDLKLSDMSGFEVLKSLRLTKVQTPILILSGNEIVEAKVMALGFGADDYLTKPFHKDELIARIDAIMRRSNAHSQSAAASGNLVKHDFLTNLPNRVLLRDRLRQAIVSAHGQSSHLAVLFLDLDHFKNVNDSISYSVGDKLLQAVSERLAVSLQTSAIVSRQGGDEFVVLVPDVASAGDAGIVAQKLLAALAPPFVIDGHQLHITGSIGISTYPEDGEDEDSLLRNSDIAMYYAKKNGRNNYQFFKPAMNTRAVERQFLDSGLRQALEKGHEFTLHYQAKVDIESGVIKGAEALLRWVHPERGLVSPEQFIPVAEESGLIVPIGKWVLREACRQASSWKEAGKRPVPIAVNISAIEFRNPGLFDCIRDTLSDFRLEPDCLELELTESALMHNAESTTAELIKLKNLGIRLAVDDFGTGYSSLSYLSKFPIDTLKIDQSFVRRIGIDPTADTIVAAVIGMGTGLKLCVTAEGVETEQQLAFLRSQHCNQGQGYYFARPMTGSAFEAMLDEWQTGKGAALLAAKNKLLPEPEETQLDRFNASFSVVPARTVDQIQQAQRIRYQVYCVENKFEDTANHSDGLEHDEFDSHSVHSLLVHRASGRAMGTTRLILPVRGALENSFAVQQVCNNSMLKRLPLHLTAEVSRFSISKEFRRRKTDTLYEGEVSQSEARGHLRSSVPLMSIGLIQALVRMSAEHGITYWCAAMEPKLLRLLAAIGIRFEPLGSLVQHHGMRQPCYCEVTPMLNRVKDEQRELWEILTDAGTPNRREWQNDPVVYTGRRGAGSGTI